MKAWRWFIALTLMASSIHAGMAADSDAIADAARSTFAEGVAHRGDIALARSDFRRAAEQYSQLSQSVRDPAVYLARGNAWLLAGETAQAIASYREGQRQFPHDENLQRALQYARSQVVYDSDDDANALTPRPDRYATVKRLLFHWGTWAIALACCAGWFLASRWVKTRRTHFLVLASAAFAVAGGLAIGWLIERQQRRERLSEAIAIVLKPTVLRGGDGFMYRSRRESPLPPGVECVVRFRRGDWLQVELADHTLGWLPKSRVAQLSGTP